MSTTQDKRIMQLDTHIYTFLKKLDEQGGAPLYTLSPTEARNVLSTVQKSASVHLLPALIEDKVITDKQVGNIALRIVRPQQSSGLLPIVIYIHGGGWILGDKETHDRLVRELANGIQAAIIFVDYHRSPEAHYPVAIEQSYAATKWAVEQASTLGLDASRLAVMGDSVGGNMAAAMTHLAKQRGGPKITFQALFYPVTDANLDTASYKEYGEGGYWLTREAMRWFWDSYAPDTAARKEITASPLQASLDQLKGLPPALIITDENDVLRDEGEAYAHKLMAAGVEVIATRYLGTIHDFMMLNPIARTPATRAAIAQTIVTLRQAFKAKTSE